MLSSTHVARDRLPTPSGRFQEFCVVPPVHLHNGAEDPEALPRRKCGRVWCVWVVCSIKRPVEVRDSPKAGARVVRQEMGAVCYEDCFRRVFCLYGEAKLGGPEPVAVTVRFQSDDGACHRWPLGLRARTWDGGCAARLHPGKEGPATCGPGSPGLGGGSAAVFVCCASGMPGR